MLAAAITSERRAENTLLDGSMATSRTSIPPRSHTAAAATGADAITEDAVRVRKQEGQVAGEMMMIQVLTDLRLFVLFDRWSM